VESYDGVESMGNNRKRTISYPEESGKNGVGRVGNVGERKSGKFADRAPCNLGSAISLKKGRRRAKRENVDERSKRMGLMHGREKHESR